MNKKIIIGCLATVGLLNYSDAQSKLNADKTIPAPDISVSVFNYIDSLPLTEKDKKQSVVVGGKYQHYTIKKSGIDGFLYEIVTLKSLLLNDKNAVEKYSTLSNVGKDPTVFNLRIIKPNGKVVSPKTSDFEIDEKTSKLIEQYGISSNEYTKWNIYKVALQDLEIGDRIEYGIKSNGKFENMVNESKIFEDLNYLAGLYAPFVVNMGEYVNSITFAPSEGAYTQVEALVVVNKEPGILSILVNEFNWDKKYTLKNNQFVCTVTNPVKLKEEYFQMPKATEPYLTIDFKYLRAYKNSAFMYTQNINTNSQKLAFVQKMESDKRLFNKIRVYRIFKSKMSKKRMKSLSETDKIKSIFYFMKRQFVLKPSLFEDEDDPYLSRMRYTATLSYLFKKYKIPYKWIVYEPRKYGNMGETHNAREFYYALQAGSEEIILGSLNSSTIFGNWPTSLTGSNGVLINTVTKQVEEKTFVEPAGKNKYISKSNLFITFDSNNVVVNTVVREENATEAIGDLDPYKVMDNYLSSYGVFDVDKETRDRYLHSLDNYEVISLHNRYQDWTKFSESQLKSEQERLTNEYQKLIKKSKEEDIEAMIEKELNQDVQVIKYEITEDLEPNFNNQNSNVTEYKAAFLLEDVIWPISDNAISIKLGYFFKDQMDVYKKEDLERESQINIIRPMAYNYTLEITLPKGALVQNLNDFNQSASSSVLDVKFNLNQEGNKLILVFDKNYKDVQAPASEWPKMKAALDLASELSQKVLIITKN